MWFIARAGVLVVAVAFPSFFAMAQGPAREYPENNLLARTALVVRVGIEPSRGVAFAGVDNRVLQAAVDYVGNLGGGTVEVGPGEYLMRDSLHMRSRVILRGAGESTVLKKAASVFSPLAADGDFGEEAITVQNPEGFAVGGGVYVASEKMQAFYGACATILNADGNYFTLSRPLNADCMMVHGAFATTVYPVISAYNAQDFRIENLLIDGNKAENAFLIDGCRGGGIYFYRGDGAVIENCTVRDYNGDGISFQQSNDVQVIRCTVTGNGNLGLHPGSGSQRPTVRACRAEGNGGDGLFFCWRVRHGVAENNEIRDNGGYGISIGHKDTDNLVRNNTIIGNKGGGVYLRDEKEPMAPHRNQIVENTIENNHEFGVAIDGETQGIVLRGNVIRAGQNAPQAPGVRIGEAAGEVQLGDNTIDSPEPVVDTRKP